VQFRFVAVILTLSALSLSLAWPDSPAATERPLERPRIAAVVIRAGPGQTPDSLAAAESSRQAFYASVQAEIDTYLAAVHQADLEAEARRLLAISQQRTAPAYHPGSTVGECTGFAIPDYIIARESGGNPSAYNPSGAYGCAQTLLSHYSSGSCAGLDPYTIDGQRECVYRLSNGGTNLAPWAATR